MRHVRRPVGAFLVLLLVAACDGRSTSGVLVGGHVPSPYPGRLDLPLGDAESASFLERTGSASRALECDSTPLTGERGYFGPNLATVKGSAEAVLREHLRQSPTTLPATGYRVEKHAQHRVLFSYDVRDRTKVAVIAVDGVEDSTHHTGWALEAWAMCDPADLPESVSAALGYQVWEDPNGRRMPTTTVQSYRGAAHCGWQHMTFIVHGGTTYVKGAGSDLADYVRGRYDGHATLPADATDTGFHRDGRGLWEEPARTAAYLVAADHVERWPAASKPILCALAPITASGRSDRGS